MKLKRIILVLSILSMLSGFLTACVKNRGKNLPTVAPTASAEKTTEAAKRVFTKIVDLDAEEEEQLSRFSLKNGQLTIENAAHAGACSFHVTDRADAQSGVTVGYLNKANEIIEVIGKETHISVWVYHTAGKDATFSFTLNGKTEGNAAEVAVRTEQASGVQHRQWTLVEADLPVPSNLLDPTVTIAMTSSDASFYFDDLRLGYDPVSKVPEMTDMGNDVPQNEDPAPTTEPNGSREFTGLSFVFEDGKNLFSGKGRAAVSVSKGGHESKQCIKVSNRSSASDGAQLDLSLYRLAGKKVKLTFWVYHESRSPFFLKFYMSQMNGETSLEGANAQEMEIKSGKWYKVEETFSVDAAADRYILQFESPQDYVTFYLDDVVIELVP